MPIVFLEQFLEKVFQLVGDAQMLGHCELVIYDRLLKLLLIFGVKRRQSCDQLIEEGPQRVVIDTVGVA